MKAKKALMVHVRELKKQRKLLWADEVERLISIINSDAVLNLNQAQAVVESLLGKKDTMIGLATFIHSCRVEDRVSASVE